VLPENKLIGGVVSGSATDDMVRLFLNDKTFSQGAVALVMRGAFELDTVGAYCPSTTPPLVHDVCHEDFCTDRGFWAQSHKLKESRPHGTCLQKVTG
jgi:small ligand-binding sensory domain FIST